jgi:spore germination protein YaaH
VLAPVPDESQREPVTLTRQRSRLAPRRAWLVAAIGLSLVVPTSLAPRPAVAGGAEASADRAVTHALVGSLPTPRPGEAHGSDIDPLAEPEALPSIQYRHAMDHDGDAIEFEPGERVTVPFSPRADDDWDVDGRPPTALPAGHTSGREIREAPTGMTWATGVPRDVAKPAHFAESREARDELRAISGDPGGEGGDGPTAAGAIRLTSASVAGPTSDIEAAAPVGPSGLRREVFGFLPYWELNDSSTVLDWKTLSTIAYFSVGCHSSGGLLKKNADGSSTTGWAGWTSSKMTSVINAAHQHQTRVVLTVSCFAWSSGGAATQAALLGSATNRTRLARQVAAAVRDRGADGVNLDFEPIVAGYSEEFTSLVRAVRRELNAIAPGYQLTFDTMGSIGNQPIADATAPGGADAVFIMGYDYRTAGTAYAGSISPLSGPVYDLTDTVKAYTAKIAPSKVILGVPYYGRAWSTSTGTLHGRNISGEKYGGSAEPDYAQAMELVAAHGRRYDAVEQSPWTAYKKQTCTAEHGCVTSWRQLYYDDAASLRLRYDLVNRTNLRGAGIWALGYDDARPELRNALADKFLADRTAPLVGIATLAQQQRDEGFRIAWASYDDSAITRYDVQLSVNGGSWGTWLSGTTLTSAIHLGTHGRTYAFRARAMDIHGNVSAWKALPLGSLGVPGGITVGGFATVATDGLRMRTSPSTGAGVMTTLSDGDALQVIGGPRTGEGYTWYQVAGPIRQWGTVDAIQAGGWVAASGNGGTNVVPRRPVFATRIEAGMTGLRLANGGARVLTPNGDGKQDTLPIAWTNRRSFDNVVLRVFRANGTLAGTDVLGAGKAESGPQSYQWDGRLGGSIVPAGAYAIQLQGVAGSTTFSVPSASPVSATQLARFGVAVGPAAPTSVLSFRSTPASPTRAKTITYTLRFGGPVKYLLPGDVVRGGSATGCRLGAPTGSGSTWTVTVSECSQGTVSLALKAGTVSDAVSNWGPASQVNAPTLVIDRTAPSTTAPRATLRSGVALASVSTGTGVLGQLTWSGTDRGGAGVASYDVARSRDGGPFGVIAAGLTSQSLSIALPQGHTYRFQIRPRDRAGNVGAWVAGPILRPSLIQEANAGITYRGAWRPGASDHYSALADTFSTSAGASARVTFTGRGIAWVTTLGPDRGAVKVYLDGVHVATVDTRAPSLRFRTVAFSRTWAASGTHTLKLVVVGTAGRPRVDLDAFAVLR